jgi:hypothetical protein
MTGSRLSLEALLESRPCFGGTISEDEKIRGALVMGIDVLMEDLVLILFVLISSGS